jgi:hypothetical protein
LTSLPSKTNYSGRTSDSSWSSRTTISLLSVESCRASNTRWSGSAFRSIDPCSASRTIRTGNANLSLNTDSAGTSNRSSGASRASLSYFPRRTLRTLGTCYTQYSSVPSFPYHACMSLRSGRSCYASVAYYAIDTSASYRTLLTLLPSWTGRTLLTRNSCDSAVTSCACWTSKTNLPIGPS